MSTSREIAEFHRLLYAHVPEIVSGVVEVMRIARDAGKRTLIAVRAADSAVCPVNACVGPRGERVRSVMRCLPGEKVDIIRWSDSEEDFIQNILAPAKVEEIAFDPVLHRAWVTVTGRFPGGRAVRLRLASRLAGWDLKLIET